MIPRTTILYSVVGGSDVLLSRLGHPYMTPITLGLAGTLGIWLALFSRGGLVWRIPLGLGGLAVAFLAMGGTLPSYDDALRQSGISQGDLPLLLGIVGGVLLLMWVLLRFAFSFGARQGIRMAEKANNV